MDNQVYEQRQTFPEGIVNNIYKFLGKHPLANLIQDFKDEFKVDTDFIFLMNVLKLILSKMIRGQIILKITIYLLFHTFH